MSDVVEHSVPRTYPLPQGVVAEAVQGRRWQRAYDVETPPPAQWASAFLAAGGSVTAEIVGVLASMMPPRGDLGRQGDDDYPRPDKVVWSMYGGDAFARWAGRIVESARREVDAVTAGLLDRVSYDERVTYLGLSLHGDPDFVRALVRVDPHDPVKHDQWDGSAWSPVPEDAPVSEMVATVLDRELVASLAGALEDSEGLTLRFTVPRARLPFEPVVAAAPPMENPPKGSRYYAVVDKTDRTAVMDLITISSGPVVKVRNGGKWADGSAVLAKLTSVAPPPLVELDQQMLQMVLAQIDGTVNDAETNPDYVESLGNESEIQRKQTEDLQRQAREFKRRREAARAITASVESLRRDRDRRLVEIERRLMDIQAKDARAREEFEGRMESLRAAGEAEMAELERVHAEERRRRDDVRGALEEARQLYSSEEQRFHQLIVQSALEASAAIRYRVSALSLVAGAVPAGAGPTRPADAQSESQHFWSPGRGRGRIKWGCTRGVAS